jgi:hypothetical protein
MIAYKQVNHLVAALVTSCCKRFSFLEKILYYVRRKVARWSVSSSQFYGNRRAPATVQATLWRQPRKGVI